MAFKFDMDYIYIKRVSNLGCTFDNHYSDNIDDFLCQFSKSIWEHTHHCNACMNINLRDYDWNIKTLSIKRCKHVQIQDN